MYRKVTYTLYVSGCTVTPSIVSICLRAGWKMVSLKSWYLLYEVAGDKFDVQAVYVLNPVTSNFSVSCFYFETEDETSVKLETYI